MRHEDVRRLKDLIDEAMNAADRAHHMYEGMDDTHTELVRVDESIVQASQSLWSAMERIAWIESTHAEFMTDTNEQNK